MGERSTGAVQARAGRGLGRRAIAALAGLVTAISGLVGLGLAAPASAAPLVRDGSSAALAAPSCWAIKQQDPSSANGTYWLQTATLVAPQQFYCDQTTNGGGWVLVGRGRDGWTWSYNGQGSVIALRETPSGPDAFAPATLPATTIDGLLDGTRVDALSDGIRVTRSTNTSGSSTQDLRIYASNRAGWTWSFGGGVNFSGLKFDSTNTGSGNTFSYTNNQQYRAIVARELSSHDYRMGFGFGSQVYGSSSASSYLWTSGGERNALPFSQVWLRPKLTSSSFSQIPAAGLDASTVTAMASDQTSPNTPWGVTGVHGSGELHVEVEAFAQIGTIMYVGGDFAYVQKGANPGAGEKIAQPYLAAFDVNTGEWISNFRPTLNGIVWDLQALPNGELAVGGEFTTVNGQSQIGLVALDTTGAIASDWTASVAFQTSTPNTPAQVKTLTLQGNWLYAAGRFNRVSGGAMQPLNDVIVGRMARLRVSDGRPDGSWKPNFNGTIVESDASGQGDRVYTVGYFTTVNGASSPNQATITSGGNGDLVPGLGQWVPSAGSGTNAKYQQAIRESASGFVWQGGSEHILEQFDRDTYSMLKSYITRDGNADGGGDIQTIAILDDVVYVSCHCANYIYTDDLSWSNPLASNTDVHNINFIAAFNAQTGELLPQFWPSGLSARDGLGAWELEPDSNGCVWFGGDFTRGSYRSGGYQWLGGFGKFCQNDHTAPSAPTNLAVGASAGTAQLSWTGSTDDSGQPVSYEILRDDRVIGTTTDTSFTDPTVSFPATYIVRAIDAAGNRSATTAGYTTVGVDNEAPSAPSALTATAKSSSSIQLSWTAATDNQGVAGYVVTRNGQALSATVPGTSFTDTGLVADTDYTYSVQAVDAAGNVGPASPSASAHTAADSQVVYSDSFTGADGSAWPAAWTTSNSNGSATIQGEAGVLSFTDTRNAYVRAQLSGPPAQVDSSTLLSYQWNSNAPTGFFSVYLRGSGGWKDAYRPVNGYGLQFTSSSGTVTMQKNVGGTTTTLQNVSGGQAATTAKQWLRVEVVGDTFRFRTWLDGSPEPTTWKAAVTDTSVTAAGQLFLSLTRGNSSNVGDKAVSVDDVQLTNPTLDTGAPSAPANLTATATSTTSVDLSWTAATDDIAVTGYRISRDGTPLPGPVTATSFSDTGLTPGATYVYSVVALDAAGNTSAASNDATVSVPATAPAAFTGTFDGTDGADWSTDWTTTSGNGGSVTIQGSAGALAFADTSGSYARAQLSGSAAQADGTVLLSYQWNSATATAFFTVFLRGSGGWRDGYRPQNGYGIQLQSNSATVQIQKTVDGTMTGLRSVSGAQSVTTAKQWLRLQVVGSTIQFKIWTDGTAEPGTWTAAETDSALTGAGQLFLAINRGNSTNVGAKVVTIDDLQVFAD